MIALIARAPRFSPNSQERDAAILSAVHMALERRGESCRVWGEDFLPTTLPQIRAVLSMARSPEALYRLQQWESSGLPILNSPHALLKLTRSSLDEIGERCGSQLPHLANTTRVEKIEQHLGYPLWLKRGDASAQSSDEVQHINSRQALQATLPRFTTYADFTLTAHAVGCLIKFYGVAGTSFFHASTPSYSKFGLEQHNQLASFPPISLSKLHTLAQKVALLSGLSIYGGDAVVRHDGSIALIDFNDWPSFSPCVSDAAAAIAQCAFSFL